MKTRLPSIFSVTLLLSLLLSACGINVIQGSGRIRSEPREVSDFTAVNFTASGELTLIQGEAEALTIEADDNLLPYIKSTVSRGTLTLGVEDRPWLPLLRPMRSIRYTLTVRTLTAVDLWGAGTVHSEMPISLVPVRSATTVRLKPTCHPPGLAPCMTWATNDSTFRSLLSVHEAHW